MVKKPKPPRSAIPIRVYQVRDGEFSTYHSSMKQAMARAKSVARAEYELDLQRFDDGLVKKKPNRRDYFIGGVFFPDIILHEFNMNKRSILKLINKLGRFTP